ncbi:MAG: helix-turn-helix transcriptional regulator [Lachnospiraceae bacterium]|nr:helix-turn-helix transcriptional regulator [Lachnospiraceae bacterium]
MTLGEKITSLRSKHKMSQGDLAEKLDVSRQSVSKWETGASTPELDKLIMMSELFHITLDELVKSDSAPEEAFDKTGEGKITYIVREKQRNSKQTAGFILLSAGLFGGVLGCVFSGTLFAISVCLLIYGVIFLVTKKYTGIVCGWVSTILFCALLYLIGIRLSVDGTGSSVITMLMIFLFCFFVFVMAAITIKTVIKKKTGK